MSWSKSSVLAASLFQSSPHKLRLLRVTTGGRLYESSYFVMKLGITYSTVKSCRLYSSRRSQPTRACIRRKMHRRESMPSLLNVRIL